MLWSKAMTKGLYLTWLVCGWLLLQSNTVLAENSQTQDYTEKEISAAYLYYFSKLTRWPDLKKQTDNKQFLLCYLDDDLMGAALQALQHKNLTAHDLPLKIRAIEQGDSAASCRILYIGLSDLSAITEWLATLRDTEILTVSSTRGFARIGGMIELANSHDNTRIGINIGVVQRHALAIDSRLLKLAFIVEEDK